MNDPPTTINEIIPVGETQRGDLNPAAVYVASLSQGSAQTGMTSALKRVAELVGSTPDELPWHQLRHSHVAALRTRLAELYAPATCNKMLSAIRGVVRQAWLLGLCTSEDAQLVAAVKNVRGSRLPAGRALTRAELVALFEACHDKYNIHAGLRDQACFAMLYGLGLRRAEAAAAKIEDYAADAGELRVIGKGGKERLAFVHGGAALAIDRWLEAAEAASTTGRVHILCPVRKGGTVVGHTGMAPNSLLRRLAIRAKEARIEKCSPHDLRRTFVSTALTNGADLAMVQALAGHASPATTARYDRRGDEAKRAAAKLVGVPSG